MTIEKIIQRTMLWTAALLCLFTGIYFALNHSLLILGPHNYILSPLGDDALDGVPLLYPVLLGKKTIWSIFHPYADHRLVIERLGGMYDYIFSQGTQSTHPFRLLIALWLGYFLFIGSAIWPNKKFDIQTKLLLSGVYMAFIFAGTTVINYGTTLMNTWPIVLIFVLGSFIFTARYCAAREAGAGNAKLITYIGLTFVCVQLALYTFGVSLILWPIILFVLFMRGSLKKHLFIWLAFAALSNYLYTYGGWHGDATKYGLINFFSGHYLDMVLYLSRLMSIPIIANASGVSSIPTLVIAVSILSISLLLIVSFLRQKDWSNANTILFAYMLFGLLTTIAIAMTRFWMEFEVINAALRFAITNFILIMCIIAVAFLYIEKLGEGKLVLQGCFSMLVMVALVAIFAPADMQTAGSSGMYDNSLWNRFFLVEATGVPIDQGFVEEIKKIQNQQDPVALNFLNDTQKQNKKGVYSLWFAPLIKKSLADQNFKLVDCENPIQQTTITPITDFRKNNNPGLFIDVRTESDFLSSDWDVIFTNKDDKIVGFGISALVAALVPPNINRMFINNMNVAVQYAVAAPYFAAPILQQRWEKLLGQHSTKVIVWRGAVNTSLLAGDNIVYAWAVNKNESSMCKLGKINV